MQKAETVTRRFCETPAHAAGDAQGGGVLVSEMMLHTID